MDFSNETAISLGKKLKAKEIGVVELTKSALAGAKATQDKLNAYTLIDEETALKQAESVQKHIDAGDDLSPIAGVPMAIKDNICTKDQLTSCGSKMLHNYKPTFDATSVVKLMDAGAVSIGKLNMDEFAMGSSTETSYYGATRNPWDTDRVPGGSSGGSAAAVTDGSAVYTLGSDTGGSIRQPCAFCGVTGIKPTYGTVSRYGLIAFASGLDQIGPIARNIEDAAHILQITAGEDSNDSTAARGHKFDFSGSFNGDVKGLKIGIPKQCFVDGLDEDVKQRVQEAIKQFEKLGCSVGEFDFPFLHAAIPTYYVIACAEASSNLSRYDGVKYGYRFEDAGNIGDLITMSRARGFGMEVKRRIMLGTFVLSSGHFDAYYLTGLKVRKLIQQSFADAHKNFDLVLTPTAPTPAYKIGENISDPIKMYLGDIFTASVNLAGLPAASIPCGSSTDRLPIGLQLIGRPFDEATIVKTAYAYQQNTDWHKKHPR